MAEKGPYLGVDYGDKWIGVAITDPDLTMALPAGFLHTGSMKEKIDFLVKRCDEKQIKRLVVGIPLNLAGKETEQSQKSRNFKRELERRLEIPVELADETLTSFAAQERLHLAGIDPVKGVEDEMAAVIMLEYYLQGRSPGQN